MGSRTKKQAPNRIKSAVSQNGRPAPKVRPLNKHLEPAIRSLKQLRRGKRMGARARLAIIRMEDELMQAYGPVRELCQEILAEHELEILTPQDEHWPAEIMDEEADVEVTPIGWEMIADHDFGEEFDLLLALGLIADPTTQEAR